MPTVTPANDNKAPVNYIPTDRKAKTVHIIAMSGYGWSLFIGVPAASAEKVA